MIHEIHPARLRFAATASRRPGGLADNLRVTRANLYSLIETAKTNGLNPHTHLQQVFTHLPNARTVERGSAVALESAT